MSNYNSLAGLDFDSLLPGDVLKIGSVQVEIKPLSLIKLATVSKKFSGFGKEFSALGITWENYSQPEYLIKLATVLLEKFPEVLQECSGISIEALNQLPLDVIVQILDKVFEVNLKSRENLEKNFESLGKRLAALTGKIPNPQSEGQQLKSQKPSKP